MEIIRSIFTEMLMEMDVVILKNGFWVRGRKDHL
jgi:hypothetical protein